MVSAHTRNIIWDMDGVLFPYTPECLEAITVALGHTAPQLDTSLTHETAEELAPLAFLASIAPRSVL